MITAKKLRWRKPTGKKIAEPEPPKHYSHKDTRSWCGGKEGREHIAVWVSEHFYGWPKGTHTKFETLTCLVCGKKITIKDSRWPGGQELKQGS